MIQRPIPGEDVSKFLIDNQRKIEFLKLNPGLEDLTKQPNQPSLERVVEFLKNEKIRLLETNAAEEEVYGAHLPFFVSTARSVSSIPYGCNTDSNLLHNLDLHLGLYLGIPCLKNDDNIPSGVHFGVLRTELDVELLNDPVVNSILRRNGGNLLLKSSASVDKIELGKQPKVYSSNPGITKSHIVYHVWQNVPTEIEKEIRESLKPSGLIDDPCEIHEAYLAGSSREGVFSRFIGLYELADRKLKQ